MKRKYYVKFNNLAEFKEFMPDINKSIGNMEGWQIVAYDKNFRNVIVEIWSAKDLLKDKQIEVKNLNKLRKKLLGEEFHVP